MPDYQNKNYQSGGSNRNTHRQGATVGQYRERDENQRTYRERDENTRTFREREEIPRPAKSEYQSQWITSTADSAMVAYAERAGKFMARKGLTNSKIRSIYGEIKRIQMSEYEKAKSSFILLKPKVAYALGRDDKNDGLKLFKEIFDLSSADVANQQHFLNFCNLMEAILAYHKAYGGKD